MALVHCLIDRADLRAIAEPERLDELGAAVANDPVNKTDPSGNSTIGNIADIAFGLIPEVGDAINIADTIENPAAGNVAVAAIGLVPELSEIGAMRRVVRAVREERVATRKAEAASRLPKPPSGPGRVPRTERDTPRTFSRADRAAKREAQGG